MYAKCVCFTCTPYWFRQTKGHMTITRMEAVLTHAPHLKCFSHLNALKIITITRNPESWIASEDIFVFKIECKKRKKKKKKAAREREQEQERERGRRIIKWHDKTEYSTLWFRIQLKWQPSKSHSVGGKVNKLSSIIDSECSAPAGSYPPDVPAGLRFTVSANSFW